MAVAIAACALLAVSAAACGGSSGGPRTATVAVNASAPAAVERTSAPNPKATSVAGLTPAQAADLIASSVTGARPLLFPNAISDAWRGELTRPEPGSFAATFRSPDGTKSVLVAIVAANPPPPDEKSDQSQPNFHGDARSLYQVQDRTDPTSSRFLLWSEIGTWSVNPGAGTVPYFISSKGMTDAEFWQVANSLHPIQR